MAAGARTFAQNGNGGIFCVAGPAQPATRRRDDRRPVALMKAARVVTMPDSVHTPRPVVRSVSFGLVLSVAIAAFGSSQVRAASGAEVATIATPVGLDQTA